MVCCSVYGCKSNHYKKQKTNDGVGINIRFYRFPQNSEMAQRWKFKCYRSDNFNIKTARICDKHFVPTDYVRNLKHELLGYSPKSCRKLKDDAVPSVNLPTEESIPPSTSRQARFDVKLRKTIVKNLL